MQQLLIMKDLEQHHLLMITLLVPNAVAMEALRIGLNKIVTEAIAIIIPVTAILIVVEILPQAICIDPN